MRSEVGLSVPVPEVGETVVTRRLTGIGRYSDRPPPSSKGLRPDSTPPARLLLAGLEMILPPAEPVASRVGVAGGPDSSVPPRFRGPLLVANLIGVAPAGGTLVFADGGFAIEIGAFSNGYSLGGAGTCSGSSMPRLVLGVLVDGMLGDFPLLLAPVCTTRFGGTAVVVVVR
jgi:hypothetical protein